MIETLSDLQSSGGVQRVQTQQSAQTLGTFERPGLLKERVAVFREIIREETNSNEQAVSARLKELDNKLIHLSQDLQNLRAEVEAKKLDEVVAQLQQLDTRLTGGWKGLKDSISELEANKLTVDEITASKVANVALEEQLKRQDQRLQVMERFLEEQRMGHEMMSKNRQDEFQTSMRDAPNAQGETFAMQVPEISIQQDSLSKMPREDSKVLTTAKLDQHADEYEIAESTWDSSIFIGAHCISTPSSILVILSILATIGIQFILIYIVQVSFYDEPISDEALQGMLHWRAWAHDVAFSDLKTHTSMVSRVCNQDSALMMSVSQMTSVSDIRQFTDQGPLLLNICLVLWFFSIADDVVANCRFTHIVFCQPRGASLIQEDGDTVSIQSFSAQKVALVTCLVFWPRLVISVLLGYTGVFFLAYTTNVGDLLLNAMALVFVLDVDELLYVNMIPQRAKQLTKLLDPLRISQDSSTGFDLRAKIEGIISKSGMLAFCLRIVVVSIAVLLSNVLVMAPFREKKELAAEYLCGGNKDFIYTVDKLTGLVAYSYVSDFNAEVDHNMSYVKGVAISLANLDVSREYPWFHAEKGLGMRVNTEYLLSMARETANFAAGHLQCIDHMDTDQVKSNYDTAEQIFYLNASKVRLAPSLETPELKDCSQVDFVEMCLSPNGLAFRSLCARHCGCDTPWLGQFYMPGTYGCPLDCSSRWELNAYYLVPPTIALFTDQCMDVPADVLSTELSWQSYVAGMYLWAANKISTTNESADSTYREFHNLGMVLGCAFIDFIRKTIEPCGTNDIFRSARPWCPFTCACSQSDMQECPRSCGTSQSFEIVFGDLCTWGTEVTAQEDCSFAAEQSCQTSCFDFEVVSDFADKGCWFNNKTSSIIWSNGRNQSAAVPFIPEPSLGRVCKQVVPMPYADKGPISSKSLLGKAMAECTLTDGLWYGGTCNYQ